MKYFATTVFIIFCNFCAINAQVSFTTDFSPEYNYSLRDTLYEVEIWAMNIPDSTFKMTLELIDLDNNILVNSYTYFLLNNELCTPHNQYICENGIYRFILGKYTRQVFNYEGNLIFYDRNGSPTFIDEVLLK